MKDLKKLREEIDRIDERLVALLNKRATLGEKVAAVKRRDGKPVYYPGREREILKRVGELSKGPLPAKAVQAIFREIFSATRSVEKGLAIACLGPEGTFSHLAARKAFGGQAQYTFERNIAAVFSAVEKEEADYGVAPIENSLEGAVGQTLDLLLTTPLAIYGELYLDISQNLLSSEESLAAVKTLYTHYMPLAQSRQWVATHLPDVVIEETSSTTEAILLAAKKKGAGAIGAAEAARLYKMNILARRIEDFSQNQTRFILLSRTPSPPGPGAKTSLALTVKDIPGALTKILKPFSDRNINLSKIESRPVKNSDWDYVFFIDCEGNQKDKKVRDALGEVEKLTRTLKILGSYPDARA